MDRGRAKEQLSLMEMLHVKLEMTDENTVGEVGGESEEDRVMES